MRHCQGEKHPLYGCKEFAVAFPTLGKVPGSKGQTAETCKHPCWQIELPFRISYSYLDIVVTNNIPVLVRKTSIKIATHDRQPCIALSKPVGLPMHGSGVIGLLCSCYNSGLDLFVFPQARRHFQRAVYCCSDLTGYEH